MGRFVHIAVPSGELAQGIVDGVVAACPVDIFGGRDGRLVTHAEREDECILCGLCVAAAGGQVEVTRAYGAHTPVDAAR